jgi:hypothetical protein
MLSSFALIGSANAGDLTVGGTAKATYSIQSSDSTTGKNDAGKNIGIANELTFTATGELDNGFTWKYQIEHDDTAAGTFVAADDSRLEITTGYGTIGLYNTEGSLSTKYKQSQAAYAAATDYGLGGGIQYGGNIDGFNNIQFHTPADLLPYSTSFKVALAPSAAKNKSSSNSAGAENAAADGDKVTQYQLISAPIDGLTVGGSYLEKSSENGIQGAEHGGVFLTYKYGNFGFGLSEYRVSNNVTSTNDGIAAATEITTAANAALVKRYDNTGVSLSFAVNDSLTVSVEQEESQAYKSTLVAGTSADTDNHVTLEVQTVQAAYTMGGMTLSLAMKDCDNCNYGEGVGDTETIAAVVMAF